MVEATAADTRIFPQYLGMVRPIMLEEFFDIVRAANVADEIGGGHEVLRTGRLRFARAAHAHQTKIMCSKIQWCQFSRTYLGLIGDIETSNRDRETRAWRK